MESTCTPCALHTLLLLDRMARLGGHPRTHAAPLHAAAMADAEVVDGAAAPSETPEPAPAAAAPAIVTPEAVGVLVVCSCSSIAHVHARLCVAWATHACVANGRIGQGSRGGRPQRPRQAQLAGGSHPAVPGACMCGAMCVCEAACLQGRDQSCAHTHRLHGAVCVCVYMRAVRLRAGWPPRARAPCSPSPPSPP
jgi:hypothetical protein